jgi:hypothetical protein
MKVCDAHPDRKAVDSLQIIGDGSQIDVCGECKSAVLSFFERPPELGERPIAPPTGEAPEKAPKWGLSFFGKRKSQ